LTHSTEIRGNLGWPPSRKGQFPSQAIRTARQYGAHCMITFPLQLVGLLLPGFWLGRVVRLPPALHLAAVFLIFEASLVLGAGVLSATHSLGHLHIYQMTTTLIAIGLALCLWLFARQDIQRNAKLPPTDPRGQASPFPMASPTLRIALAIAVGVIVWTAAARLLMWAEGASYRRALQLATLLVVLAIAVCTLPWMRRLILPLLEWPLVSSSSNGVRRLFAWLLSLSPMICLAGFAALMLWVALNAVPAIEDSLTIKLPKIVFAIESNSFLPSDISDDGRMYISPVYPALIQLFLIINGHDSHSLLVFGFVNWVVCAAAIYQICRFMRVSEWIIWLTIALVLLSPVMIAQGSSEGDDIIGATPFVVALAFFASWIYTNRPLDAMFAGIGLGLSIGIKLLPLLYLPAAVIVFILALFHYSVSEIAAWARARGRSAVLGLGAFIMVLVPEAIGNWIAFGNPFYVSSNITVTRNAPFSFDCALRSLVGYVKQFLFSDLVRLFSMIFAVPSKPQVTAYQANVAASNDFLAALIPYDPTPACSAWGTEYAVTNWYGDDVTYWFGIFGFLLLISALYVAISRKQPFLVSSLGVAFLVWVAAFMITQKYIVQVGRYWSLPVLAGSPVVAVALDRFLRNRHLLRIASWIGIFVAATLTTLNAAEVLLLNPYRSVTAAAKPSFRYIDEFGPDLRKLLKKATNVNVQVLYAVNTYDYYMLRGKDIKFTNKSAIVDDAVNIAVVRPFSIIDNPFFETRIPVRMNKSFSGAFRYFGRVPQGFSFANNTELVDDNQFDPGPAFLLFQVEQVEKNGFYVVGYLHQIANPQIAGLVRYRAGWRNADGELVMQGDWLRGEFGKFKVPADATKLVVEAALGETLSNLGAGEWPLSGSAQASLAIR
jgi:hypothetical protein